MAFMLFLCISARAQAPSGPLPPKPGVTVQQPPRDTQPKVKVQVALVNTPVTVRDTRGEMVNNLEAQDFQITDNGVAQQISHFDLGGDPISAVILIETSSRIAPLFPEMRKTGILFTQTVVGPSGEAAVVGFNDSIDKLQDFTTNSDLIENTIAHLGQGTSGSKLYDAMAAGVEMLSGRPLRGRGCRQRNKTRRGAPASTTFQRDHLQCGTFNHARRIASQVERHPAADHSAGDVPASAAARRSANAHERSESLRQH
jgi:VWFA-related protein